MQHVSESYKQSMKSPLRERGFIKLSFGLLNKEAQTHASVTSRDITHYSDRASVFKDSNKIIPYATLEENFTKVDGSMLLLQDSTQTPKYTEGVVSEQIIPHRHFIFEVYLNVPAITFKGLTVDFGDNYPIDFDITTSTGQIITIRNNDKKLWYTEAVFENIDSFRIQFRQMKNTHTRARIYSVKFGYGLMFGNESVLESSLQSRVSPISAEIPQYDLSVKIKNEGNRFDIDNPDSLVNFLETGMETEILYGYQLPNDGGIEWLQGATLQCSSWNCDGDVLTINSQDVLRDLDKIYDKGVLNDSPVSYGSIFKSILDTAGVTDFYIDPKLSNISTVNPVPLVKCKEALQIVANASRSVLNIDRNGRVTIIQDEHLGVNDVPVFTMNNRDMTSKPKVVKKGLIKEIVAPCYIYLKNGKSETVASEEAQYVAGEIIKYTFKEALYDYEVRVNGSVSSIAEVRSGLAHSVSIRINTPGRYKIELLAKKYSIIERTVSKVINRTGKTLRWANPLIDNGTDLMAMINWLAKYYSSDVEYEYSTRGHPELETTDVIYQENQYRNDMKVTVLEHVIDFKQVFSGRVVTRRAGG